MKKLLTFFSAILLFSTFITTSAQSNYGTATESWAFGFGFSYPRWFSSTLRPQESNYGGFLSIQKNFTEHTSLRLKGYYRSIDGRVPGGMFNYTNGTPVASEKETVRTNMMGADLTFNYEFMPCEPISPYLVFGAGFEYADQDWGNVNNPSAESSSYMKWIAGIGANWRLNSDWDLTTEVTFSNISNTGESIVDNNRNGMFGSNTSMYTAIEIGGLYYFAKGEPSNLCQLYSGINVDVPETDYERIENIVKKYIPREVVKEVVVEVPVKADANWVLAGTTFDFNKATLKKEAYPILWHATQVMLQNPDLKVEIQGYTDGIGSDKYNLKLSEKRAQAVKNYLAARGISESRMVAKGYGKANPVASNKTAEGRALNRRIEFKVLD